MSGLRALFRPLLGGGRAASMVAPLWSTPTLSIRPSSSLLVRSALLPTITTRSMLAALRPANFQSKFNPLITTPIRWSSSSSSTTAAASATASATESAATAAMVAMPAKRILVTPGAERPVAYWMFASAGLVFGMVVVGGVTRLTRSGLSITEWRPQGSLPPQSEAEWEEEFAKYKRSPEFRIMNPTMDVHEFKSIFWWEYIHRMIGRGIGLVFGLPAAYFWARGYFSPAMKKSVGLLFLAGGSQGAVGWWMVKSGLEEPADPTKRVSVSPYRLAFHLAVAFGIYSALFYTGLSVLRSVSPAIPATMATGLRATRRWVHPLSMLVGITAFSGAFVAGLDAGHAYNTYPKMAGEWVPSEIGSITPWYRDMFENIATVQFTHRWLAFTTLSSITAFWFVARRFPLPGNSRVAVNALAAVVGSQFTLGLITLLYYVPIPIAAAHQAGALTLFSTILYLMHSIKYPHLRSSAAAVLASRVASPAVQQRVAQSTLTKL